VNVNSGEAEVLFARKVLPERAPTVTCAQVSSMYRDISSTQLLCRAPDDSVSRCQSPSRFEFEHFFSSKEPSDYSVIKNPRGKFVKKGLGPPDPLP
jgi:hypothetical protein